uniref:Cytochrome c oxidase subunit 2 n=1 Tax=Solanum lycopersicum TaxID=4081 RepID=A0A3Q7JUU5_SOLLC
MYFSSLFLFWFSYHGSLVVLHHISTKKNPIPQRIVHGTTIEIHRNIFPSIILMLIDIPSFALSSHYYKSYWTSIVSECASSRGWASTLPYEYWDYKSSIGQSLTFGSYTIQEDDQELGQSHLLEVDNRVVLPAKSPICFIVTSDDVSHSWVVPSLGIKCNVIPSHLNQTSIMEYDQCSEIRGNNHEFIPIIVEVLPMKDNGYRVFSQYIPQSPNKQQ